MSQNSENQCKDSKGWHSERLLPAGWRANSWKHGFPNLDIDQTADEVKLEIMESKVELKGVNVDEVGLFLACAMTQKEVDKEGLTHVVPRRRFNQGTRPGLTCPAITGGPKVRAEDTSWLPALRQPTPSEATLMVSFLAKWVVKRVMKNHL